MVKQPAPGDVSHAQFVSEKSAIFESLKKRAVVLVDMLNSLENVTCNPAEGAMYAFPRIRLPPRAVDAARSRHQAPDAFYCFELLEATGICVVPGSGFGQVDGTFHFRTTFLPRDDKVEKVAKLMKAFHADFMRRHA